MSDTMPVSDARADLAEVLNRVGYGHERLLLTRRGKAVAALVSAEDLALLEELEMARDVADYDEAMAADDGKRVSLAEVKARIAARS